MSKKPRFPPKPRNVVFVLFPGFQILDVTGPLAAFEIASRFVPGAYKLKLAAREAGLVPSSAGVGLPAEALAQQRGIDTLIVSGGHGTRAAAHAAMVRLARDWDG